MSEKLDEFIISTESSIHENLVDIWEKFKSLPEDHPSDQKDFANAIHQCQRILATRVARRIDPQRWYNP